MTVFKRTFVIHQNQDDSWIIKERSVDMTKEEGDVILSYLEELSSRPLGPTWTERDWRYANEMRIFFLRNILKHPDWQEE